LANGIATVPGVVAKGDQRLIGQPRFRQIGNGFALPAEVDAVGKMLFVKMCGATDENFC
jgi:hypothetical protein